MTSVVVLASAWVALGAGSSPAGAHSDLVSSNPADGADVAKPPATLVLTFSEGVAPSFAAVTLKVGDAPVRTLEPTVTGDRVSSAVPADLRVPGRWSVAYRVVSADSHPVTGRITFSVAAPPAPAATPTPTAPATSPSAPPSAREGDDDEGPLVKPASREDGGVNPAWSVLALAIIAGAPLVAFVVIGNRKRREDKQGTMS